MNLLQGHAIVIKFILLLIFCHILINEARKDCRHRDYGNNGTVCVCNLTYCDDLDPVTRYTKGNIILYESTKSGERFKETLLRFGSASETTGHSLTINRSQKYQKIIGFGGSFTDSAGINIASLPKQLSDNIMREYFSKNGLEFNMGRIPIAGTDYSIRAYSYDDVTSGEDKNLTQFALQKEDLEYKIPYIKEAQKHQTEYKIKLFSSAWSSPAWMKTNNELNHGGSLKGEVGGEYYQYFANYILKFLNAYKDNGVDHWGITALNEPRSGADPKYRWNCLLLTPEQERDFVKLNLGPTLEKAGYGPDKLKIMINDDQRDSIVTRADTTLKDPAAAKYVAGLGYHWYEEGYFQNLDTVHERYPNYFILATEASEFLNGRKILTWALGNWALAEHYATDIISGLQHYSAGWIDWNYALDLLGGPTWAQTLLDASIIVNATANEYYKEPKFYALGHFSKFLTPDSVRVEVKETAQSNLQTVAFVRPDNATVLIVVNTGEKPVQLNIDDPQHGKFSQESAARSIQTFIWWE